MSDHLCEQLTDEIFQRLPIKSLLRFRSLSKSWFSRIASPDFIRRHRIRYVNSPLKLLIKHCPSGHRVVYTLLSEERLSLDYETPISLDISAVDLPSRDFEIIGSCNGILCIVYSAQKTINLWNPSIRRKLIIPEPLHYIQSKSGLVLGFGFDPITEDYKIVMISYSKTDPLVYSMRSDSWSLINTPTMPLINVLSRACLVNGTLHWVVECKLKGICIMTFDLSKNVCGTIEFPEPWSVNTDRMIINDSLAVFYTNCYKNRCVWVRRETNDSDSWPMVVRSLPCLSDKRVGRVLQLADGDFLLDKYKLGLTVYNPVRGESSFPSSYIYAIIDMETYAESLVLLDRGVVCKGIQQSCDVEAKTNGRKIKSNLQIFLEELEGTEVRHTTQL